MEETKYMELLLVKPIGGGSRIMALCESCKAHPGDLVRYGDNSLGRIERVAWAGAGDDDVVLLLREAEAVHEAREIFSRSWENDLNLN